MFSRLVRIVIGLVLLATPALTVVPSSAAPADYALSAPATFSPNGDGTKDGLRVRYTLPRRTHVYLAISGDGTQRVHRTVDLGVQPRGTHVWTWDGRNQSGRELPDKGYVIRMYDADPAGHPGPVASAEARLDSSFKPELTTPTFGAGRRAVARVFPRTRVVADVIDLRAVAHEGEVAFLELVIRNDRGRVVRRADVDERIITAGGTFYVGRTVSWAAVRGGKPLPKGRYTAVVTGADLVGNRGRSDKLKIWVSADRLVWREATTTVAPDGSRSHSCEWSAANDCGVGEYPDCGDVVPSTLYAGGLSYRSKVCAPPEGYGSTAASLHLLEIPEATGVRGLAAVRVAFVGAPTTAGESDTGTLRVAGLDGSSTVVGTAGQSGWVEDPAWGEGLDRSYPLPQRDPAAVWSFATTGTDSVDVATFTVDVRYLAIED
ncbi:FlgD immunoglobulin-like domain containing protein [Nocardioides astragali]|uniref:FlgD immunoglobulin-like domain containing protein n=1 Tax=Nocardioides astragali TaxID=1776736 RepID=A0ABW2MY84_9ACTN|nr:FlgD immunoglobulin-like domain containing protein [Nocardioides astragali]